MPNFQNLNRKMPAWRFTLAALSPAPMNVDEIQEAVSQLAIEPFDKAALQRHAIEDTPRSKHDNEC